MAPTVLKKMMNKGALTKPIMLSTFAAFSIPVEPYRKGSLLTLLRPEIERHRPIMANTNPIKGNITLKMPHVSAPML